MNKRIWAVALFSFLFVEYASSQIEKLIPSDRRVDWRNPGYAGDIPRYADRFINVNSVGIIGDGSTDVSSALITLINNENANYPSQLKVLFFPAGTYKLNNFIDLPSNLIIKGEGSDKTVFSFGDNGITIIGSSNASYTNIQSYTQATKTLVLTSSIGVQGGQLIEITVPNGWWHKTGETGDEYVGQIVKVQSANGTTLVLEDDIHLVWLMEGQDNRAKVHVMNPVQQVGVEDIKIISSGLNNTHISFDHAANCWVNGVESENPGLHHVGVGSSFRIEIRGSFFHEAKKVCTGGQGYGVFIGWHSTDCLVEDNIFRKLRHSMIAYGGATRNVFGFNYSGDRRAQDPVPGNSCYELDGAEADLLFHGRFPIANLAEGNVVDYICGEVVHGINGPYNTVFRNRTVSNDVPLSSSYGGIRFYPYGSECQLFNSYGNTLTDIDDQDYCCGVYAGYNGQNNMGDAPYSDVSYYYEQEPQYLVNAGLSWPPVGTRTDGLLSQTNPAELRWWSGNSKKTVSAGGISHPISINLAQCQCIDGGTAGGSYVVAGTNRGSSWSGTITAVSITITAVPSSNQFMFYQWSDGSSANPRTINTGVNIYATYKAHLASSLSSSTGLGNQRKIVREYDGGPLDMVYSSSNKIWLTTSTDNGSTWSNEQQISGSGTASNPSIAVSDYNDVYITWQEILGSTKYLYIKSLYGYIPTPVVIGTDVSSFDFQQSIAASDDGTVLVVYRKGDGLGNPWKLYYTYSNDGSTFPAGQQVFINTPVDFDYPSVAWNSQIAKFMVSGNSRSYSHTVPLFTFASSAWQWPCNVYTSTSFPPTTPYSQIAVDGYGRTHITWIAYDNYYEGVNSAAMHKSYYNGSLSAVSLFRVQDVPIIYSSVSGHNDANGGVSLFFCGNPTDYLRDIYSTDGSSWNGTINISPSGNRVNYPISLEKAPPSSVSYTVVKGSSSPYNVISQTKDNSQPGYGYGTLKTAATDANAQTATLYRRVELIDTTTGGLLAVQFGNISSNSSPFQNINPDATPAKGISNFMRTSPFTLQQNASMEAEFGVRSKGWRKNANISLELVDTVSGKTVRQIGSYNFAASDTGSFFQEKTNEIVNKLQNINGVLRVKIDSVDYENLVVNYMNVFAFGGSGTIKKQEKNIVQIGEMPTEFQLTQNYPNPFNPTTQINYQLPANGYATLKIYDVLGREIATLVDEEKSSGFYSVQWDAHNVSSGIYFYRLTVSNGSQRMFTDTKRMVVMK